MAARRRAWIVLLDTIVLAPLVAAILSPVTRGTGLALNLSVGLGLLGTSLLAIVVMLMSRVQRLTRTFGIGAAATLHHWAGAIAVVLLLGHTVVAVAIDPRGWALLDLTATTGAARAAVVSLIALLVLVVVVVPVPGAARYALRARLHAVLAAIALVSGAVHIVLLRRLVTDPVVAGVLAATALAVLAVLLQRWVLRPLLDRGAHVVTAVRRETESTATVVLAPTHLRRGLTFEPGQFVWLRMHRDVTFSAEHPFTIAAGRRTGQMELTFRHRGDFTTLLRHVEPGRRVWVDGPHGGFVPSIVPTGTVENGSGAAGLVLIAGGVGITPMMSILRAAAQVGDPRPHQLLVAQRRGEELFPAEIDALTRRLDLDVVYLEGRRLEVRLLDDVLPGGRARYDYYLCGPTTLLDDGVAALRDVGVPDNRIHLEVFT